MLYPKPPGPTAMGSAMTFDTQILVCCLGLRVRGLGNEGREKKVGTILFRIS